MTVDEIEEVTKVEIDKDFNFEPLYDRIVVRRISSEEKTKGGLYIPEKAQTKQQWGTVVATGLGRLVEGIVIPLRVKNGDMILFEQYGGEDLKIDGEEYLIIKEPCVIGIKKNFSKQMAEKIADVIAKP